MFGRGKCLMRERPWLKRPCRGQWPSPPFCLCPSYRWWPAGWSGVRLIPGPIFSEISRQRRCPLMFRRQTPGRQCHVQAISVGQSSDIAGHGQKTLQIRHSCRGHQPGTQWSLIIHYRFTRSTERPHCSGICADHSAGSADQSKSRLQILSTDVNLCNFGATTHRYIMLLWLPNQSRSKNNLKAEIALTCSRGE